MDIRWYKNGSGVHCRCGLVFIGTMNIQVWSAHTWKCPKYEKERKTL